MQSLEIACGLTVVPALHPHTLGTFTCAVHNLVLSQAAAPARAFVCQNFTCRAPTSDPAALRQLLQEPPAAAEGSRKPAFTEVSSINLV